MISLFIPSSTTNRKAMFDNTCASHQDMSIKADDEKKLLDIKEANNQDL